MRFFSDFQEFFRLLVITVSLFPHHCHPHDDDDEQGRSRRLPLPPPPHQRLVLRETWPHSATGALLIIMVKITPRYLLAPGVPAHSPKTPRPCLPSLRGSGNHHNDHHHHDCHHDRHGPSSSWTSSATGWPTTWSGKKKKKVPPPSLTPSHRHNTSAPKARWDRTELGKL